MAADMNVKTRALRAELAEIINRVCEQRRRAVIHRRGRAIAAVVSIEELAELDRVYTLHSPKTVTAT